MGPPTLKTTTQQFTRGRRTGLPVRVSIEIGAVVLSLSGEIDIGNAAAILDAVRASAGDGDDYVVIDLTDVTFMDSRGLAAIEACEATLHRVGIGMIVRNASSEVRRLFHLADADGMLV